MNSRRLFHALIPTVLVPIASNRDPRLVTWLLALGAQWARPPQVAASDFQDTQPSVRDNGSEAG